MSQKYTALQSHAFVQEFTIEPKSSGSLTGLTFAVKDLIDVAGYITGCGNPTWEKQHPPAAANAICVDQLLYAGAKCLGKTVTSQFAFDLIGENVFFDTPLNPKAPEHVPGGSSSGSASAVACNLVDFALGTDTGGSIRVPASNCGVFGMRPSHDIISVAGVMPFAPTFDTVGIVASSFDVLKKAAKCLLSIQDFSNHSIEHLYPIRDAFQLANENASKATTSLLQQLSSSMALSFISLHDIDQDFSHQGLENWLRTFSTIHLSEIWSSLGSWIEASQPDLGEKIATSFRLAKEMDRSKLSQALLTREIYFKKLLSFLGPYDLLCIPTTPTYAPLKNSIGLNRAKDPYYQNTASLTCLAGIGGLPQITVPCVEVEGKPLGLSFLAAHQNDAFLLQAVEQLLPKLMGRVS